MQRDIIENLHGEVYHTHGFDNKIQVVLTDKKTGERFKFTHEIPYELYMDKPMRLTHTNAFQLIVHCKRKLAEQWVGVNG